MVIVFVALETGLARKLGAMDGVYIMLFVRWKLDVEKVSQYDGFGVMLLERKDMSWIELWIYYNNASICCRWVRKSWNYALKNFLAKAQTSNYASLGHTWCENTVKRSYGETMTLSQVFSAASALCFEDRVVFVESVRTCVRKLLRVFVCDRGTKGR